MAVTKDAKADLMTTNDNSASHSPPPGYQQEETADLVDAFAKLSFSTPSLTPTVDQCIAHLKFLEALNQLREDVGTKDGLYGLKDEFAPKLADEKETAKISVMICEKRWAIYVTNATLRFEKWWAAVVKPGTKMAIQADLESPHFPNVIKTRQPLTLNRDTMPPLGEYALPIGHISVLILATQTF